MAAAVTSTIRLGTAVALPAEHDPITLAKTIASLDHLSGGRVELGVGFGWNTDELADHGVPAGQRRAVLREYLAAMQTLWSQEEASYQGEFVSFGASWAWPKPVQQPRVPILAGAGGREKTFRWIARHADGWLTTPGETDLDDKVALLHQAWHEAGRAGRPRITALAGRPDPDQLTHWAQIGVTDVAFGMPDRSPDEVVGYLGRLAGRLGLARAEPGPVPTA
jgi:probable F420-dependent oxidoreductase